MRFPVPPDSPYFAGHFPGHPILPGIAHLALVTQALGGASILEIPALRLRSPVRPGDVLTAKIDRSPEDGPVRFELRREEELVSNGTLRLGSGGAAPALPEIQEIHGPFPPVAELLPHAPPARLVRSVLEASPEGLTGVAEIPTDNPFATGGQAPAFVGLEAAAQGAAVLEALGRQEASGPRIGYLVAIRGARCAVPVLPAGRPFRFTVRLGGSAPPLSIYEVRVEGAEGAELLRGTISTYILAES
jgi:3-hydroxymyristoyl/3-hydroxydecanoyl-(acyl carrier protein) dehydratase